jgi:hypothetical protein
MWCIQIETVEPENPQLLTLLNGYEWHNDPLAPIPTFYIEGVNEGESPGLIDKLLELPGVNSAYAKVIPSNQT